MPHVTDGLGEAVQACDDDKANTQGNAPNLACAMTQQYAMNGQIVK